MTINNFSIEYDAINSKNTFTNGDTINGRIIVEVSKETKVKSLVFSALGYARVRWRERRTAHGRQHHNSNYRVYWAEEKYYEIKNPILREARQDGTEVIGQGRHVFPFSFTIPDRKIPSSFIGPIGKIVHKLKAELKQSMKLTKHAKARYTFVAKADMDIPGLLDPQYGCKDKSVKTFGSGNLSLDAYTTKMGYKPGEVIQVATEISNRSSRSVKPKFVVYEKRSFFAQGHRKVVTTDLVKDKVDSVEESSGQKTVNMNITIPKGLPPSILNCSILKLEYRLKVYLDIKYAVDPEVKLPIVVLPEDSGTKRPPAPAAAGGIGFEALSYPNQPAWGATPRQAAPNPMAPPPPYGAYAAYPSSSFGNYKTQM